MTTIPAERFCSDQRAEPLPGTAKAGRVFIALEHAQGWGYDIMDGDAFGPELTARMANFLALHGATLQLIRKPGRIGQMRNTRTVYFADTTTGRLETLRIDSVEQLFELGELRGVPVEHPVVLVCTHGKRDRCCALKGRPLAAALEAEFPGDIIWESSHTKGHRFAPSLIALPWGYSYGHLNLVAATDMVRHLQRGELFLAGNRGRSCLSAPDQVAELAVAEYLLTAGETVRLGYLDASGGQVRHSDGRLWNTQLKRAEISAVMASCGAVAKPAVAWHVEKIVPVR